MSTYVTCDYEQHQYVTKYILLNIKCINNIIDDSLWHRLCKMENVMLVL